MDKERVITHWRFMTSCCIAQRFLETALLLMVLEQGAVQVEDIIASLHIFV